jgi:hypothetical protein
MSAAFRPLPTLGGARKGNRSAAKSIGGKQRFTIRKSLNYQRIKEEAMAAIAQLPAPQRNCIPAAATLPEQMIGLALAWLGYLPAMAQAQISADGGRLRVGGAVVDWLLFLGGQIIAIRVQGTYWHSQPGRKLRDVVQYDRLHAKGYLVSDIWEHDIYQAWVDGRLKSFVADKIQSAA